MSEKPSLNQKLGDREQQSESLKSLTTLLTEHFGSDIPQDVYDKLQKLPAQKLGQLQQFALTEFKQLTGNEEQLEAKKSELLACIMQGDDSVT